MITLGVIGVVAALTLPTLINTYNNHLTETRVKKFYSTFNQAILLSSNENGDPKEWNYSSSVYDEGKDNPDVENNFDKYLRPYMKIVDYKILDDANGQKRKVYYLPDGSAFGFNTKHNREVNFYPKNPEKCIKTSKEQLSAGKYFCSLVFNFYPGLTDTSWVWQYLRTRSNRMEPFSYTWDGNIDSLTSSSLRYACNNDAPQSVGAYCALLMQLHGWRIPKGHNIRFRY